MVESKIAKQLKEKHPKLTISQITSIIDIIFNTISENLIKNRSIEIRTWGRFSVKIIKARHNARNPKTNEIIYTPERKKVSFRMSKNLKEEINKIL
ncbi:MAG: nucleoid DNA-binding protein [Pelagibacterales bacterium]|nr:nucleoid DNA-binding protein [Pelagibacterales bacterium]